MILSGLVVSTVLWANPLNPYVWIVLAVTLGFGFVGFYDDYLKVTKQTHGGFAGRIRLALEAVIALVACSRNGYVCCPSLHRDHTVGDVIELLTRMRASALVAQAGYGADGARNDLFDRLSAVETLRHVYRLKPAAPELFPVVRKLQAGE